MMTIISLILFAMFGPPVILTIAGFSKRKSDPEKAKLFFILAASYLVIGGGICITLLS